MAKKEDKGKIRVFLFELEGTNETLLESVKSITGALNRTFGQSPKTVRLLTASDGSGNTIEEVIEDDSYDDASSENEDNPSSTNVSKQKRPRRVTTPNILTDLDLKREPLPLKEFITNKKPTDNTKRYLAIALWLKDHHQIEEISSDHIYTCYRFLGWNTPRDTGSVFRDGKKAGYYVNGTNRGFYKLTHVGENRLTEEG
jgi:hypothetical protein